MEACPLCCNEAIAKTETVVLGVCGHALCMACALQSIRLDLVPGHKYVHCPMCTSAGASGTSAAAPAPAGGAGVVAEEAVRKVHRWSNAAGAGLPEGVRPLADEELARYVAMMVEAAVAESGNDERPVQCPNAACACMIIVEKVKRATQAACPYCNTDMCIACGEPWAAHRGGKSCEQVATLKRDAALLSVLEGAQGHTFKPCPGCGEGITHFRGHACHHSE
jgi:hypothetical protein